MRYLPAICRLSALLPSRKRARDRPGPGLVDAGERVVREWGEVPHVALDRCDLVPVVLRHGAVALQLLGSQVENSDPGPSSP